MPRFLSPEWITALGDALTSEPLPASETFGAFTVRYVVSGGPDGPVAYEIIWAEDRLRVEPGEEGHADIVITTDHVTARAINCGTLTAQEAVESDRLTVRGGLERLASARRMLTVVEDRARELRAETTYDPAP